MTITKTIIRELEHTYRSSFPGNLKMYLFTKYSQESSPHEYSEQDLYTNIDNDISEYEAGRLDISVKSPSERWLEEWEYLHNLYIKKYCEAYDLYEYVTELESLLSKHGLKSSGMVECQDKY